MNTTTNASMTLPDDLLKEMDGRAEALDLSRSQYIRALARKDLAENLLGGVKFSRKPKRRTQSEIQKAKAA